MVQYFITAVLSWSLLSLGSALTYASDKSTVILVDKKTNQLHLSEYDQGHYRILRTYHATLGRVKGDKEDENDLKTPEGIYHFVAHLTPPGLRAKFGAMAFPMNFPNAFDRLAGRTGNGIMLHATNEPDRLKQNYDSEGCVVLKNEEIREIQPYIRLGRTPILVFAELTPELLTPGEDVHLKTFFESWIHDWESKNLDGYMNHYHSEFTANGKNKGAWKTYKGQLNSRYSSIEVDPQEVRYYRHPKYSVVTFVQNYRSRLKGGAWGHRSSGSKTLFIAEEGQQLKIIAETFSN